MWFLPNTYYWRIQLNSYVYQLHISLVLAITAEILYRYRHESSEIMNPTNSSSSRTMAQTLLQSVYVLPNTYY
jgi:hypothetical protein